MRDGSADLNNDGYITANELGLFLHEKVTIYSEKQQTPQYARMTTQEGEFVFKVKSYSKDQSKLEISDLINLLLKEKEKIKQRLGEIEFLINSNLDDDDDEIDSK